MHSLVVEEAFQHREATMLSLERGKSTVQDFACRLSWSKTHHTVSSAVSLQATVGQRLKHPRASIIHRHNYCIVFSYRFLKFKIRVFCCPGNRARVIRKRFLLNCHRIGIISTGNVKLKTKKNGIYRQSRKNQYSVWFKIKSF